MNLWVDAGAEYLTVKLPAQGGIEFSVPPDNYPS